MAKAKTAKTQWRSRIVGHDVVAPATLTPHPENWRTHPAAQTRALAGTLTEVGWVQNVIVNKRTGRIVDGHARVELALSRNEPGVPVVYVDLTEDEERLVLLSLDPLASLAETNLDMLDRLLDNVRVDNNDLRELLDSLRPPVGRAGRTDPDEVPAVPETPVTQRGDLWLLGDHRLLCGDATKADDVARLIDGASPTLLVTDPPYGVSLDPTWRDGVYNKLGPAALPYMTEAHENRTLSGDTVVDWSPAFALVPSLEVAYVWHAGVHAAAVGFGLEAIGFEIRSQIIWAKSHFAMSRGAYHWQHEPCWFAVRKGKTANWIGDHSLSTLWALPSPKMIMGGSSEAKFDHPAQKPIECMERPVRNHRGDVYEPFVGSGTTLMACERQRRRCFGMEIDPRYVDVAVRRWEAFTGQEATRE